jgi:hypothetical protein
MGQNVFTSADFQSNHSFQKLGRLIAANQTGNGCYQGNVSGEDTALTKKVYWTSVDLYGTEWRVVGVHNEKTKSGSKVKGTLSKYPEERLNALAGDSKLVNALSTGDPNEVMPLFKALYKTTSGVYAIEWIDENGINRFGYPTSHSLTGYDFHQHRETGDQEILDILKSQKTASMILPLSEGGTGIFNFAPVHDGSRYLGMIYIIRLK